MRAKDFVALVSAVGILASVIGCSQSPPPNQLTTGEEIESQEMMTTPKIEARSEETETLDITALAEEKIVINLPSVIYACEGLETNVFFENLTEHWDKYEWDLYGPIGAQMERGYRLTPTAEDAGSYELFFRAEGDGTSSLISTKLLISPRSNGEGKTVSIIVLGDSTTDSGFVISCLNANLADDPMSLVTLGTRGSEPNFHEGRSGWTLEDYCTRDKEEYSDERGVIYNPFFNPETNTFDAAWYFDETGIEKPDWFFINMGINDMFSCRDDDEALAKAEKCICYLNQMIESIIKASPHTRVGICLPIPPNHSQDAFGKAYGLWQTRERYRRNNLLLVNMMIEKYDNRTSEMIYLVPIHLALDTVWNMGMETIPVNARNLETEEVSPIKNGGVHPDLSGYWQIADVYTAFLKAFAGIESE